VAKAVLAAQRAAWRGGSGAISGSEEFAGGLKNPAMFAIWSSGAHRFCAANRFRDAEPQRLFIAYPPVRAPCAVPAVHPLSAMSQEP